VLAIVGPTASGKSRIALELARRLGAEIISADSRQVYRMLDIGTAKPTSEERACVVHHCIDICDPAEEYNAGMFGEDARAILARLQSEQRRAIVVGGSGLYIRSLIDGLFEGPSKDPRVRLALESFAAKEGPRALWERLRRIDPVTAERHGEIPVRRIIRALEVYELTGIPISEHHRQQARERPFHVVQIALDWPREQLYGRINERARAMIDAGLVDEVRNLRDQGFGIHLNALNSVGYKEVFAYLSGALTEPEMIAAIQQNTRRFAKRQLTWFRADKRIEWIKMNAAANESTIIEKILSLLSAVEAKSR
jgi:tRNA dimethylallyltransferase